MLFRYVDVAQNIWNMQSGTDSKYMSAKWNQSHVTYFNDIAKAWTAILINGPVGIFKWHLFQIVTLVYLYFSEYRCTQYFIPKVEVPQKRNNALRLIFGTPDSRKTWSLLEIIWKPISDRPLPNISQFKSSKLRQSTFLNFIKFVDWRSL